MSAVDDLAALQDRVVELGIKKLSERVTRLEGRRFFFFFRVRILLRRIKILLENRNEIV